MAVNPGGLLSTITQIVGQATMLIANPQYAPLAVGIITGSVDGQLQTIPVVGGTLASGFNQIVGTITSVIGPGQTLLIPYIGSVSAIVGGVTSTLTVILPTGPLATITGEVGSIIGSVTGGIIGSISTPAVTGPSVTGVTPLPTGSIPIGTGSLPVGTGSLPIATGTSSRVTGTVATGVSSMATVRPVSSSSALISNPGGITTPSSTPKIPTFSNAAMLMAAAPQNQLTGLIAIFVTLATLMLSTGALMVVNY